MTKQKLDEIVASHGRWLVDNTTGDRADLRGADLRDANLHRTDLRRADLRRANLSDANLSGANLSDANLRCADLRGADLRDANLRGADLRDANLRGADLRGADMYDADLRCAILPAIILQVGPIGSRRDYVVYNVSDDNIRCGCWNDYKGGPLEEFEERVEDEYPPEKEETLRFRNEYLAVIGYFKTVRETCLKEKQE